MKQTGLVLEGGGMRGVYTGGVLERFMEWGLYFPYVIGVSAGACNAVSYLSRQRGRNRRVTIDFVDHPEYLSFANWIRKGSVFGMELIFDRIPNELDPLDYEALFASGETFVMGTTDPLTGLPQYYGNEHWRQDQATFSSIIKASSSLPFFAPSVEIAGKRMYDGGVSDPIPVRKALEDGCERLVIVLTKDASYRIKPFKQQRLARILYRHYPGLVDAMIRRERVYNETMELIAELEKEGRAFVIRPSTLVPVKRMERDKSKLEVLYKLGEDDADAAYEPLRQWLSGGF
ncbi:patatin-like phospholipase family protein [Paenibacillus thermotolerans]|uniref:patatin-like phospholipase family protein n=1 Tax=Paenibacillus thermotolerans TaxID=3027807 RepID=UPI0023686768|nr:MULTISPECIES: patatin family protein [unclassified Paenibacillus]